MDMTTQVFSNTPSTRIADAIRKLSKNCDRVQIAVAFFTQVDVVKSLVEHGIKVDLIVRLGYPTSPDALAKLLDHRDVKIRYLTDPSFHPKLYIFGYSNALVGSANLTTRAMTSNQEIVVCIGSDDPRFDELQHTFEFYWEEAEVLNSTTLKIYKRFHDEYQRKMPNFDDLSREIEAKIGKVVIGNITREKKKQTKSEAFRSEFSRVYQDFVQAFQTVKDVYVADGRRRVPESECPVRIEIDNFLSFLRDAYAGGDRWNSTQFRSGDDLKQQIQGYLTAWHDRSPGFFEERIVPVSYPAVKKAFHSQSSIQNADDETLVAGLRAIHSFNDRRRFFESADVMVQNFLSKNGAHKIRNSFSHLLYGEGSIVDRMVDLLYEPDYRLIQFGRSNVQELVGWYNKEDLPIVNARTTKVMRFLGFNVQQL
jgi:HKD family nuclease